MRNQHGTGERGRGGERNQHGTGEKGGSEREMYYMYLL